MAKKVQKKKVVVKPKKQQLACNVCGVSVTVDECGCEEDVELFCCGKQMKQKK